MQEEVRHLIVYTVGGTPEPIIKSILTYKPEICYFLCSKETEALVGKIIADVHTKDESLTPIPRVERIKNHEDILDCYRTAHLTLREAREEYPNSRVSIDYTGGTKSMTAGLALAAAKFGISTFKYIGGDLRDPVTGRVISGHERPLNKNNPFQEFVIEEIEEAVTFFNNYHFDAAESIFKKSLEKVRDTRIELAAKIAQAFECWDTFQHTTALDIFEGTKALVEAMQGTDILPQAFLATIKSMGELLPQLVFMRGGEINPDYNPNLSALDMICNAERRIEMERYDDAVIREYRAVEMIIGGTLAKNYGLDMSYPDWRKFERSSPEKKEKFLQILRTTELPRRLLLLWHISPLLKVLDDPLSKVFEDSIENIAVLKDQRDDLILVHGFKLATKELAEHFLRISKDFIVSWLQVNHEQLEEQLKYLRFPKLSLDYLIL